MFSSFMTYYNLFITYLPSSPIQTKILPGFMSLCENPVFLKCFIPETLKQDINTCSVYRQVKNTAQLQTRGCFTLILGYGLYSLLETLLWLL